MRGEWHMRKRICFFILLSALVVNIIALKDIKKMNNEGPWDEVIKLTTIKSDIIIDFTDNIIF